MTVRSPKSRPAIAKDSPTPKHTQLRETLGAQIEIAVVAERAA